MQQEWNEDSLRLMLHKTLTRHRLSALDVIRAWDGTGDMQLSEAEFVDKLGALFAPGSQQRLYTREVGGGPRTLTHTQCGHS